MADERPAVAERPWPPGSLTPAETLGGGAIAREQLLARPRQIVGLVAIGVVEDAQLHGVHAELHGELVHRALERESARDVTGRAHRRRRVRMHADEAVTREDVRARVRRPRGVDRFLRVLLVRGRLPRDLGDRRGQSAVASGAERDALLGMRTEADGRVTLTPAQLDADGAADTARGERRNRDVRPCAQRRAEGAADERRDHAHVVLGQAEHVRDDRACVPDPLRLVPERQPIAVPRGDGRVHLDRVVMLARMHIGGVHPHLGLVERAHRVATACFTGLGVLGGRLAGCGRARAVERGLLGGLVVRHADEPCRVPSILDGLRHDHTDRLAAEHHVRVLKHAQRLA